MLPARPLVPTGGPDHPIGTSDDAGRRAALAPWRRSRERPSAANAGKDPLLHDPLWFDDPFSWDPSGWGGTWPAPAPGENAPQLRGHRVAQFLGTLGACLARLPGQVRAPHHLRRAAWALPPWLRFGADVTDGEGGPVLAPCRACQGDGMCHGCRGNGR